MICTGQPARFVVDTINAGAGPLSVTIDGPSKVELSCKEVENGYGFKWIPSAPGDYMITIKYAGNYHIVGSPFKAHVTGKSKLSPPDLYPKSVLPVYIPTQSFRLSSSHLHSL